MSYNNNYLLIMFEETIIALFGKYGYYARTSQSLALCQSLAQKNLIHRKKGTKKVFLLSDEGRRYLQNTIANPKPEKDSISHSSFFKIIKQEFNSLRTSYRPFVKIPVLRNRIIEKINLTSDSFSEALLWLHEQGKITLEVGFTADESTDGIEAKSGKFYYYLIDVCQ
ncbi:MAG: hypothetical protein ACXAC7_03275 [Candidatus Hodarchaeales archaeon]